MTFNVADEVKFILIMLSGYNSVDLQHFCHAWVEHPIMANFLLSASYIMLVEHFASSCSYLINLFYCFYAGGLKIFTNFTICTVFLSM